MENKKERIYLYDTTLRDGGQTSGVHFRLIDKLRISQELDELGIDYIEGGWPGANPTDDDFFASKPIFKNSKLTAFGMTKKLQTSVENDPMLNNLINSGTGTICIVGKTWDFQVEKALAITKEDNLNIIRNSISYLAAKKIEPIFDAEHFFDGYKNNKEFALRCIKEALNSGARWIVLCDTNGGSLPHEIESIVPEVIKEIPGEYLGIHCHNDTGCAVANTLAAVKAGVRQVQGTINGLGERCGNANLTTLIPNLMLKMGYDVGITLDNLHKLKKVSNFLDDLLNREQDHYAPYVGTNAFTHKGGLHASAMEKDTKTYEHIRPEVVGNERKILISNQAGASNIIARLKGVSGLPSLSKEDIRRLVELVKRKENEGYTYDSADASFIVLVKNCFNLMPKLFEIESYKVLVEKRLVKEIASEATVKIKVIDKTELTVAEGNGPINALDCALRKGLLPYFPELSQFKLTDYKVRIITNNDGTSAITRVHVESEDIQHNRWSTTGVSYNIIDASFNAIYESILYFLTNNKS